MMKVLKIIGSILIALVVLAFAAGLFVYLRSEAVLNQRYATPTPQIRVSSDEQVVARGKHLATAVSVCVECHGQNLGGGVFIDDPALGRIIAPNLTSGKNGLGAQLSDADFARAIRFGVLPDGRSVRVMPSQDYQHLSDADLGALIAYIRSVPPVDSDLPLSEMRPLGRALLAAGKLPIMIASELDMGRDHPQSMEPGVTVEYGRYLGNSAGCTGCHGPGLSGGPIPAAPPDWPPALNLTPSGELAGWSEANFIQALRTGITPDGRQLSDHMPWKAYRNMTDDELKAIWLFVKSAPAREAYTH